MNLKPFNELLEPDMATCENMRTLEEKNGNLDGATECGLGEILLILE